MDTRRATASAVLRYALLGVASTCVGAVAALGWLPHAVPHGVVKIAGQAPAATTLQFAAGFAGADAGADDRPLREDFRATAWPLADGGFLEQTRSEASDCLISRIGPDGKLRWSQRMPAACTVRAVDAAGNAWVQSDALYRLAADGSAQRVDDLRRAALIPAAFDPSSGEVRLVPADRNDP